VKQEGLDNDLLDRLKADKNFQSKARGGPLDRDLDWEGVMDPMKYVGRSVEQTERFIKRSRRAADAEGVQVDPYAQTAADVASS
jgi:hypothetical protein